MRIPTQSELDALLREHVETAHYLKDGETYEPPIPPAVDDPEGDDDSE